MIRALASAHGGTGFNVGRFLEFFLLITFAYCFVKFYDGKVNNHYFKIFGTSMALGVIAGAGGEPGIERRSALRCRYCGEENEQKEKGDGLADSAKPLP